MIQSLVLCLALVVSEDLGALDKKLKSSDDRERAAAVTELAKIGSKEAWNRVIDALKDPASNVGDEAEISLAKLNVPELVDELLGKRGLMSGDERVQLRAAGVLGALESGSLPGPKLVAALGAKSMQVRRTLRASVERLLGGSRVSAPDRLAGALESWTKSTEDPEVRAAGLSALVRLPGELPPAPVELAKEGDPPAVTCAILSLLAGASDPKARAFIVKCSLSSERAVRSQVVQNIVSRPDADGLKLLVTMFENEKNRRVSWAIDGALEKLSGLSGGGKPDFWRAWVDNLGPEWVPATGNAKPTAERALETTAPKLAGFPIVGSAVAILVDFSGSTWEIRGNGKTRKERLDIELTKALESLPPDTLFNVIPFATEPIPFEKALVPATTANVARALKFFTSNKTSGKGNVWSAIELALEDQRIDTILVLSDGAPTGGLHWNIDLMRDHYLSRDRFRHVALDAILVDSSKRLQEKWKTWCESTGGRMLAISLQ